VNYWKEAALLIGHRVVIWMPISGTWKRGYLVAVLPHRDLFRIKWTKKSNGRNLYGIWRVHHPALFRSDSVLPIPLHSAILVQTTSNKPPTEGSMATKPKAKTKPKPRAVPKDAPKSEAAKKAPPARTKTDKLAGLSEVKRRNIAKFITKERAKKPATSWPKIVEAVEAKYDWTLPGSMTGRRLMRDYGPDDAESAIIKQTRTAKPKAKAKAKAKAKPKAAAAASTNGSLDDLTRAELKALIKENELDVRVLKSMDDDDLRNAIIEAGWEPEADEDEELEEELDEEEDDSEDEDEEEEDEDTDDEEEDEDEEEEPEPPKRVTVKRGAGRRSNPS
jgi:hypothetical protein